MKRRKMTDNLKHSEESKVIAKHFGLPPHIDLQTIAGLMPVMDIVEDWGYDTDIMGRNYDFSGFCIPGKDKGHDYNVMIRDPKNKADILIQCSSDSRDDAIFCALLKFAQEKHKKL